MIADLDIKNECGVGVRTVIAAHVIEEADNYNDGDHSNLLIASHSRTARTDIVQTRMRKLSILEVTITSRFISVLSQKFVCDHLLLIFIHQF